MKLFTAAVIAASAGWTMTALQCEGGGVLCLLAAVLFVGSAVRP